MIDEIDYTKYLIVKTDDLKYLTKEEENNFIDLIKKIDLKRREKENKKINNYLVLNIDDEFNPRYLIKLLSERYKLLNKDGFYNLSTIAFMTTDLINSILIVNRDKKNY